MAVRHRGGKHTSSSKKLTTGSNNEAVSNGSSTGKKNNESLYTFAGMALLAATLAAAFAIFISTQKYQSRPSNSAESSSSSPSPSSLGVSITTKDKSDHDVNEKTIQPPLQQQTRYGTYKLLERVPHDANAFTQGLEMLNETHYYESLGLYGESSVRIVQLSTGAPVRETPTMDSRWFGEGLCKYSILVVQDGPNGQEQQRQERLIQITWMEKYAFIYDSDTLQELQRIPYDTSTGQGWGIAFDEARNCFYVTDGSSLLHTWNVPAAADATMNNESVVDDTEQQQDATTTMTMMTESRPRVEVFMTRGEDSIPIRNLNELEYDASADGRGTLLANVWYQDVIVRIDPETGFVPMVYNLQSLYPRQERPETADVLNGIALVRRTTAAAGSSSSSSHRLQGESEVWVTGKKWPWMYRIRLLDDDEDA